MNDSSREAILARVRARLGRDGRDTAADLAALEQTLAAHQPGPRPAMATDTAALVKRFCEKSLALSSTLDQCDSRAAVPQAVAAYLSGLQLPLLAVVWPELAVLDWRAAGVEIAARGAEDADLIGITSSFCALAETGTLMLCGAPERPATVSLLPETHIAIVSVSRIVPDMEAAWELARKELGSLPRAVNFISGPSRTAGIEQTIVIGAHGPYRVHLILVADE